MKHTMINRVTAILLFSLFVSFLAAQEAPADTINIETPVEIEPPPVTLPQDTSIAVLKLKPLPFELTEAFSRDDKLRKRVLLKKQNQLRGQLDILSMHLLWINEQLQDPNTRIALSRKMKETPPKADTTGVKKKTGTEALAHITARNIDLAAVDLIRNEGLSLDQARLAVIEGFTEEQVAQFYRSLSRDERYALYDVIDKAMFDERFEYNLARKSAIFFHLYAY